MSAAPPPIGLSVLIRTLNEADRLARTLQAVQPLGAEIVIIDADSKDDTVAIARSFGAIVINNPWPGFGPQRRFGEDKCSHDFIFSLDADEVLTDAIVAEIRGVFLRGAPPRLMIVRKAVVFPHHDKPPPWPFCHEQILIYDRRIARTGLNPNWDQLEISAADKPVRLKNPLWHFSLRNLNHAVSKALFVGQLAADTQRPRLRLGLALRLPFEFPIAFLKYYFLRRYFLAGLDGFVYGMVGAFSRFIRIALMAEKRPQEGK
ncbi:glycosyltransferase family 2 protein [Methylocapsa sp. S129]|uniref:glycosyltransferase family 2 protein n=1 Tax=Methylocapsa sp. S129 TaxID=1641869 RepID=UPI001FED6972|nr:glycosyltransferase family 2 protein [Methylocapsa sp. S129]